MENQTVNVSESLTVFLQKVGLSDCLSFDVSGERYSHYLRDIDETLHQLGTSLSILTLAPSEVLFREGSRGDALYLVWHGELQVYKEIDRDRPLILGSIAAGQWVGELQVLLGGKRTASVRALEES